MNADPPGLTEPRDPALDGLFRALTAAGTPAELAGRGAAVDMFLAQQRPARRRRGFAVSLSSAAAALALAGGVAAAYASALPGPAQHIAYQMLGGIGVPDTQRLAPTPSGPGPGTAGLVTPSAWPSASATATAGCPCPTVRPTGTGTVQGLVLVARQTRIPAGGKVVLAGAVVADGRAEAGVRVRLVEYQAARSGPRVAGNAVSDSRGEVSFVVTGLTNNASFRLMVAGGGAVSSPLVITVVPSVTLDLSGAGTLTAAAPFGRAGDVVVLQERYGGAWHRVGARRLDGAHQATFIVPGPAAYRVVLAPTAAHGAAVSAPVRVRASRARRAAP